MSYTMQGCTFQDLAASGIQLVVIHDCGMTSADQATCMQASPPVCISFVDCRSSSRALPATKWRAFLCMYLEGKCKATGNSHVLAVLSLRQEADWTARLQRKVCCSSCLTCAFCGMPCQAADPLKTPKQTLLPSSLAQGTPSSSMLHCMTVCCGQPTGMFSSLARSCQASTSCHTLLQCYAQLITPAEDTMQCQIHSDSANT